MRPDKTAPDTPMMQSGALHGSRGESDAAPFYAVAAREPALWRRPFSSRRPPTSPVNVIWSQTGARHSLHRRLQASTPLPPLRGRRHGWDNGFDDQIHSGKMWSSAALAGARLKSVIGFLLVVALTVFERRVQEREGEEGSCSITA